MKTNNKERVVVSGMGFCLPGENQSLCTTKEAFWDIISNGKTTINNDGFYFGQIFQTREELQDKIEGIPSKYLENYSRDHLYALISAQESCKDAGLDFSQGELKKAAVLTGRVSLESCINIHNQFLNTDIDQLTPKETNKLLSKLTISGMRTDVVGVLAAFLQSEGTTYSASAGCASTAVLCGTAIDLIRSGKEEMVVVCGADASSVETVKSYQNIMEKTRPKTGKSSTGAPPAEFLFDRMMRPYDENSCGFNSGEGSITLIFESEEHAMKRKASIYGEVLAQVSARSPMTSAFSFDEQGNNLKKAIRKCLDLSSLTEKQIDYINGGSEGDILFNMIEANATKDIFNPEESELYLTSQEACFGHNASPLGNMGIAATLLMMRNGEICPTAGCENVSDMCLFNPLPGSSTHPANIDYALSFNYQPGGVASVISLAAPNTFPNS